MRAGGGDVHRLHLFEICVTDVALVRNVFRLDLSKETITKLLVLPLRNELWVLLAEKVCTDPQLEILPKIVDHPGTFRGYLASICYDLGRGNSNLGYCLGRTVGTLGKQL